MRRIKKEEGRWLGETGDCLGWTILGSLLGGLTEILQLIPLWQCQLYNSFVYEKCRVGYLCRGSAS